MFTQCSNYIRLYFVFSHAKNELYGIVIGNIKLTIFESQYNILRKNSPKYILLFHMKYSNRYVWN